MRREFKSLVFFLFFIVFQSSAQEIVLHPKTLEYSSEVFRDCMEYTQPQYLSEYSAQISQVSIIELPEYKRVGLIYLSQVGLKNKCNPDMARDEANFDPLNFNPLKYFFNFYGENDLYIQVDNTSYVILIKHR